MVQASGAVVVDPPPPKMLVHAHGHAMHASGFILRRCLHWHHRLASAHAAPIHDSDQLATQP